MTTLQDAIPVTVNSETSPEAQEARWIAWKAKATASDRITQRRVRMAFAVIVLVCVTLAMLLL